MKGVLNQEELAAIALASRQSFLYEEAPDQLATLEQGIEQLRQGGQEYTPIIRAAHSLKGGAGLASMPELSRLAHKLEDLLIALRLGRITVRETADKLLSQTLDRIAEQLLAAMGNQELPEGTQKLEATTAALEAFLAQLPAATAADEELEPVASSSFQQPSFYKTALTEDLEECLQRLEADITAPAAVAGFVEEATLLGETLGLTWLRDMAAEMAAVVGQELPEAAISEIISGIRKSRTEFLNGTVSPPVGSVVSNLPPSPPTPPPLPSLPPAPLPPVPQSPGPQAQIPQRFLKYLILQPQAAPLPGLLQVRVPLTRLEEMGDRAAELLAQCQRLQDPTNSDIPAAITAIRSRLEALSADITNLRLVPFRQIAERYYTPLESLKQQYHKQVQLIVQDPENLVDQVILEQLQAPLTHLFRNAFDHGIELPVERKALGKPPIATITLAATTRRAHLEITITDDGRGIDTAKVHQRALEKGLINQDDRQLTTAEILQFLFTPGFSTASRVTDLSGRGVGLDIVLSQVSRLGGSLELATELGYGTKFIITVPLTQTVLTLYFFQSGGASLALSARDILDIIDIPSNNHHRSQEGREEIIWQNQSIPLFNLANFLPYGRQARRLIPASAPQSPETPQPEKAQVIIIDMGQKVGLVVDNIIGKISAAVKPFDPTLPVPAWVEGWTWGSGGEVVPCLSGASLAELIPFTNTAAQPTILVVDDSPAVRRTLEMVLSSAGFAVVTANDGTEGIAALTENAARFSLVISDLEMPNLDGFGLLAAMKNHPIWRRLPVVMLTSQNTPYHRRRALELGAALYLTKPFEPATILASLSGLGLPKIGDIVA
ncbi:MAG TPA: response regulator [Oscillatoriaceae cyanobacterium M33_DOE_052]|uniref:histidine kinase n=1 Tax=Planktothricoides sp. SpSt-374 TaxID=2282167 RepID=A0A7C3ZZD8_9CYAN|nr:response regulator [Oscillatoriaceae cyanobacterium M33_DOE_052]